MTWQKFQSPLAAKDVIRTNVKLRNRYSYKLYYVIQTLEKSLCEPTYSLNAVWSAVFQSLHLDFTLKVMPLSTWDGVNPERVNLGWRQH